MGGAFVGEGQARLAAFGWVEETAIRVGLDAECENKVSDGGAAAVRAGCYLGVHITFGNYFLCTEVDDTVDFFLDARAPAAAIGA